MKVENIIRELNKKGVIFSIENFYNEFNKEIFFKYNGVLFQGDITTGKCYGFITENKRVYSSLKHILK